MLLGLRGAASFNWQQGLFNASAHMRTQAVRAPGSDLHAPNLMTLGNQKGPARFGWASGA